MLRFSPGLRLRLLVKLTAIASLFLMTTVVRAQNIATVGTVAGSGQSGSTNGSGTGATFNQPNHICFYNSSIMVADSGSNKIRQVSLTGSVSLFAGSGTAGNVNLKGALAAFNNPTGIFSDSVAPNSGGFFYVVDMNNQDIRRMTTDGKVSFFAGGGKGNTGLVNGDGNTVRFNNPSDDCMDSNGNLYVADMGNNVIRMIAGGTASTFAGSGTAGHADGKGTRASFNGPAGICVDSSFNVYVADTKNNMIRKITPNGTVSTIAGSTQSGSTDGNGTAKFNHPSGICVDSSGNLYVADTKNNKIRKITPNGTVSTFAGTGQSGSTDGQATAATFNSPIGICIAPNGDLYVADTGNNKIRKIYVMEGF